MLIVIVGAVEEDSSSSPHLPPGSIRSCAVRMGDILLPWSCSVRLVRLVRSPYQWKPSHPGPSGSYTTASLRPPTLLVDSRWLGQPSWREKVNILYVYGPRKDWLGWVIMTTLYIVDCEYSYSDCSSTSCWASSPGHPGIYPQHSDCLFRLNHPRVLLRINTNLPTDKQ